MLLALVFFFEGGPRSIAFREFRKTEGGLCHYQAFRQSKNAVLFLILFEDPAALIGLAIAPRTT